MGVPPFSLPMLGVGLFVSICSSSEEEKKTVYNISTNKRMQKISPQHGFNLLHMPEDLKTHTKFTKKIKVGCSRNAKNCIIIIIVSQFLAQQNKSLSELKKKLFCHSMQMLCLEEKSFLCVWSACSVFALFSGDFLQATTLRHITGRMEVRSPVLTTSRYGGPSSARGHVKLTCSCALWSHWI